MVLVIAWRQSIAGTDDYQKQNSLLSLTAILPIHGEEG